MILASFATIVGVLAQGQVRNLFVDSMNTEFSTVLNRLDPVQQAGGKTGCQGNLIDLAGSDAAQIRLVDALGDTLCSSNYSKSLRPINRPVLTPPAGGPPSNAGQSPTDTYELDGMRVMAKWISWGSESHGWLLYARSLSQDDQLISRIRVFLAFGVVGGAILALLAGLYVAQRAMRPIADLTDAAREIELTRDPTRRIPQPEAEDEVAELAQTLEGMLASLAEARAETESALNRQRQFVADASHELRTPLTSVLANLELLADELDGEQADSANSALRSTRRMRRLVGDLLLLARADANREQPHRPTDIAEVLRDAAGELSPVAGEHDLTVFPGPAVIDANRDEIHRVIINLIQNAISHTPPGTAIRASTAMRDGQALLVVQDEGPGIPERLRGHVFDRFVRGHGDGGRGTGLGLAIVRAVTDSHAGTVMLTTRSEGDPADEDDARTGTRFELRFPLSAEAAIPVDTEEMTLPLEPEPQTSTTTGRTIGRRLRRS